MNRKHEELIRQLEAREAQRLDKEERHVVSTLIIAIVTLYAILLGLCC